MTEQIPENTNNTYTLLDSGNGRRLDKVGRYILIRPAQQAEWEISNPELWDKADAEFIPEGKHRGRWQKMADMPDEWNITFDGINAQIRLAKSGQIGIFPEQLKNWRWIKETVSETQRPLNILNCFAYTGLATLFASSCHSDKNSVTITHLDSAKPVVNWARKNALINHVSDNPVKWMVEDVLKFMKREIKRGRKYDGIILDPPAFGRGPKGESWKLQRDLKKLATLTGKLLSEKPLFILLSCHAPDFGSHDLEKILRKIDFSTRGSFEAGTLVIPAQNGTDLPNGIFARISEEHYKD